MPLNSSDSPQQGTVTAAAAGLAAKFAQARALHQQGQLAPARSIYQEILQMQPEHFDTLNLLGVLAGQTKDLTEAVRYFDRAIAVEPKNAAPYCNRGLALKELGQLDGALASFDQAIALNHDDAVAQYGRGNVCKDLGQVEQALASYDAAAAINPTFAQAHFDRGALLQQIQKFDLALASYERAIEIKPDYAEAYANKALLLHHLKRLDAALAGYDQAIAIRPDQAPLYVHRGNALKEINRLDAALTSYDQAIAIEADYAEAYSNRGVLLYELNRIDAALASYDRAIAIKPDYAEAYFNRASVLRVIKRYEDAAADYKRAAALDPGIKFLSGACLEARMQVCDWSDFDAEVAHIAAGIERGEAASHPFAFLTFSDSPRLQRKAAEIWVRDTCLPDDSLGKIPKRAAPGKIRVGYFSADFREHPVASLLAELIESHDRSRFDVIAFSFGPKVQDEMRKRLERAFDRFLDVHGKSNLEIAALVRSLSIDIAVDLAGYTHGSRPNVFALRAAPVQVSYIGYLGTTGADYMDYLIADPTIIPPADRKHYSEKILYLPSYQANDSKRRIADRVFTRQELDLPATGFVFCCFNTTYKITPATFALWMRILTRVQASVLFLYADTAAAVNNLRKEARRRGVDPDRLVFGKRLPIAEYLARYRAADLFLDTLPYNAGTTASDALWAGLPVLTCVGETFAGRIAASVLRAIRLPELIAYTREQYEELAVELATDPQRLAEINQKLAANRLTEPLFDTRLFTKQLESGYSNIQERYQADLPPDHIHVGFSGY
jgi:predicted O-linked N-acetylglucosamine transferase (SPINDLY family)